jgi:hypothetical protein
MNDEPTNELITRLSELIRLCPDMRFGQLVATLGLLAEDDPGQSMWDIEDTDLVSVMERFRQDLVRREQGVV